MRETELAAEAFALDGLIGSAIDGLNRMRRMIGDHIDHMDEGTLRAIDVLVWDALDTVNDKRGES